MVCISIASFIQSTLKGALHSPIHTPTAEAAMARHHCSSGTVRSSVSCSRTHKHKARRSWDWRWPLPPEPQTPLTYCKLKLQSALLFFQAIMRCILDTEFVTWRIKSSPTPRLKKEKKKEPIHASPLQATSQILSNYLICQNDLQNWAEHTP